jgi:hypothetical protein
MRRPAPGDMFIVRPYGASLWVSLADPPAYNPLEHLVTGSRLLYLGESTDYYVQVLSQSGKVGWVHRGNVIGAAMPSRAQMLIRAVQRWWMKRISEWWTAER